jgi:hypothetical protein
MRVLGKVTHTNALTVLQGVEMVVVYFLFVIIVLFLALVVIAHITESASS